MVHLSQHGSPNGRRKGGPELCRCDEATLIARNGEQLILVVKRPPLECGVRTKAAIYIDVKQYPPPSFSFAHFPAFRVPQILGVFLADDALACQTSSKLEALRILKLVCRDLRSNAMHPA
jgi:hypothetical protein